MTTGRINQVAIFFSVLKTEISPEKNQEKTQSKEPSFFQAKKSSLIKKENSPAFKSLLQEHEGGGGLDCKKPKTTPPSKKKFKHDLS